MKAALYIDGRIVTGENHGIAFGKLSPEEQGSMFLSGFFDPTIEKFVDESGLVLFPFMKDGIRRKKIILIRHAHVQNLHVTDVGRQQAHAAAGFLFNSFDLDTFEFVTSPVARCVETLQEIGKSVSVSFCTDQRFAEKQEDENAEEFISRLQECVYELPDRAIICTHCDCIINLLSFSAFDRFASVIIPHCSSSYIDNGAVLWVGRSPHE